MEPLLERMSICYNNPKKPSTTKINKNTPSGYSLLTHYLLDATKNKLDCYRGKECIERFCKDLKERATKITNYAKKEMMPLICYICKKDLILMMTIKIIIKLEITVIILKNVEKLLMICKI